MLFFSVVKTGGQSVEYWQSYKFLKVFSMRKTKESQNAFCAFFLKPPYIIDYYELVYRIESIELS